MNTIPASTTNQDGSPKTRGEFMLDLVEQGMTAGEASAAADAAGMKRGYRISHEQMEAVVDALAAARGALSPEFAQNATIRGMALEKVERAFAAFPDDQAAPATGPVRNGH